MPMELPAHAAVYPSGGNYSSQVDYPPELPHQQQQAVSNPNYPIPHSHVGESNPHGTIPFESRQGSSSTPAGVPVPYARVQSTPVGGASAFTVKPHYSASPRPGPGIEGDGFAPVVSHYPAQQLSHPQHQHQRAMYQRSATLPPSSQWAASGAVANPMSTGYPLATIQSGSTDPRIRHFSSYNTVTGNPQPPRNTVHRQRCYSGGASSGDGSTVTTLSMNTPHYRSYYTAIGGRIFQRTVPQHRGRPGHHASSVSAFSADLERQTRHQSRGRPGGHASRHHTALGVRDGYFSSGGGGTASPWGHSTTDGIAVHPTAGSLFTSAVAAAVDTFTEGVDNMRRNVPIPCYVTMLDGHEETFYVPRSAKGAVLFERVCKSLDLFETEYFGLTYRSLNNVWFWLSLKKRIRKYLAHAPTWRFEFQVKFYPAQPIRLKEPLTRYLLCLQIRQDIVCKKLPCSFNTFALLGAYVVQSELGDYNPGQHGYGVDYIQDMLFAPASWQTRDLLERIAELHKLLKGLSPEDSDVRFMENAKKLSLYGVDFHKAKDMNDEELMIGVYQAGILVYVGRLRVKRFFWSKILKISYLRSVFRLFLRPSDHSNRVGKLIEFRCQCSKMAKRLWKACVEHHAFFRLRENEEGLHRRPAFFTGTTPGATTQGRSGRRFVRSPHLHTMTETAGPSLVRASSVQPAPFRRPAEDMESNTAYRQRGTMAYVHRKPPYQRGTASRQGGVIIPRNAATDALAGGGGSGGGSNEWYGTSPALLSSQPAPQLTTNTTNTTGCQTSMDGRVLDELLRNPDGVVAEMRQPEPPPRLTQHAAYRSASNAANGTRYPYQNLRSTNIIPRPEENLITRSREKSGGGDQSDGVQTATAFRPPREKTPNVSSSVPQQHSNHVTMASSSGGVYSDAGDTSVTHPISDSFSNVQSQATWNSPYPVGRQIAPGPVECHFHPITSPPMVPESGPGPGSGVGIGVGPGHHMVHASHPHLPDGHVETVAYHIHHLHHPQQHHPQQQQQHQHVYYTQQQRQIISNTMGGMTTPRFSDSALHHHPVNVGPPVRPTFPPPPPPPPQLQAARSQGEIYAQVLRSEKVRPKALKRASLLPAPKWRMSVIDISPGLTLEPLRGLAVGPSVSVSQRFEGGGARCAWAVSQCGRYFFEVIVTGQQARSAVRVGWSVQSSSLLLGEDRGGFGFGAPSLLLDGPVSNDLSASKNAKLRYKNTICSVKITGGESTSLGDPLVSGDVIGCYLDLYRGSVFWSCNGRLLDDGLGLQIPAMHRRDPFFPAVAINNCSLLVNFGESPFVYPPPASSDWLAVSQAPRHLLVPNVWQGWHLNPYDGVEEETVDLKGQPTSSLSGNVQFSADALVAQTHGSSWVGVRANRGLRHSEDGLPTTPGGISPAVNGCYFYEVVLLEYEAMGLITHFVSGAIVGWSAEEASVCLGSEELGIGYGTEPSQFVPGMGKAPSCSIVGGKSLSDRQASSRPQLGDKMLKCGDVIGCALDLDSYRIFWFVNGSEVRQVDGQELMVTVPLGHREKAYFPTVSMKNATLMFNFGDTPFRYPPARLLAKPVSAAPKENVAVTTRQAPEKPPPPTWSTECAELLRRILVSSSTPKGMSVNATTASSGQEVFPQLSESNGNADDTLAQTPLAPQQPDIQLVHQHDFSSTSVESHRFMDTSTAPFNSGYGLGTALHSDAYRTFYATEYKGLEQGQPQVESVTYFTPEGNRMTRTVKRTRTAMGSQPHQQDEPCPVQMMAELGDLAHSAAAATLITSRDTSPTAACRSIPPPNLYLRGPLSSGSRHASPAVGSDGFSSGGPSMSSGEVAGQPSTGFFHKTGGSGGMSSSSTCHEGIPAMVTKTAYYCYHPSSSGAPAGSLAQERRPSSELTPDEAAIRHLAQSIHKRDSRGEVTEVTMFQTRHPCNATETTVVRKIQPVSTLLVQDEEQIV